MNQTVPILPGVKGYYILMLNVDEPIPISRGRWRWIIEPGIYYYVGSAYGLGGLYYRVKRHYRKIKKIRWHIDSLTTSRYVEIIYIILLIPIKRDVSTDLESYISNKLIRKYSPIKGFGCSDKRNDYSHLFYCKAGPDKCIQDLETLITSDEYLRGYIVVIS